MLPEATLTSLIRAALPDARVEVEDLTGTQDHYAITVISEAFRGKSLLTQQRMVYAALGDTLRGPIHALALNTRPPRDGEAAPE